ncbi:FadR family transcriptional regulator [Sphingomonas parva]|uniref:FadR family transcriptional regulator n=1 Tax=Sphingomonas parva TaxID=2555898 RepID=A0A4Y8ZQT6_9SPHN|nr:FadR/GntR family transcriptional regulator [Sphingomonas parva]TFI57642.1 FadR family transcriptional regulator [Sphingomonas parva]
MHVPARKLYQRIAEDIAAAIADGRYRPGTRLPGERDLAEEFAVSRPTIREAMIALEIRGMVEARQGSGIYVTQAPPPAGRSPELDVGAFELNEARILFEGEAAALAATSIEDETLAALDRVLESMAGAGESPGAVDADREFHLLIAEGTGNSIVRSVVEMLWQIRESSPLCVHMFGKARREGVTPRVAEHRLIVDALRARNPQAAREAMRAHLRRVTEDLLAATEVELIERAQAEAHAQRSRIAQRASL